MYRKKKGRKEERRDQERPDVSQCLLPVRESQSPMSPLPTPPMIPPMGMMAASMGA